MAKSVAIRHPEPMSAINVTPFIDVLLVLLIMMILTVPVATHKLPIDLPGPGTVGETTEPHKLSVNAGGQAFWDGRAVNDAELGALLRQSAAQPGGEVHFKADESTRYERAEAVLTMVKRAGVTSLGFVGLERMKI